MRMDETICNNDGLDIIERTYNKVSAEVHKSGFVDGITSGRDSVFQDGFDEGYKDGFLNGFKIGQQQGIFLAAKKDESNFIVDHTTRGNCQICGNQELLSLTISKLSTHQTSHFKEKYRTIEKTYKHLQNFIKD